MHNGCFGSCDDGIVSISVAVKRMKTRQLSCAMHYCIYHPGVVLSEGDSWQCLPFCDWGCHGQACSRGEQETCLAPADLEGRDVLSVACRDLHHSLPLRS
jgi:hypothetical protein